MLKRHAYLALGILLFAAIPVVLGARLMSEKPTKRRAINLPGRAVHG